MHHVFTNSLWKSLVPFMDGILIFLLATDCSPASPVTDFTQGPCDPCAATLPYPLTRDVTSDRFANWGVICKADPFEMGVTSQ